MIAGLSKQALFKYRKAQSKRAEISSKAVKVINQIRKHHKRMGCRKIYYTLKENLAIGRDKFEQIGFANGFKLKIKRNTHRTTWSQRVEVYPNLIEGITIDNINKVWQSDIFYLSVEGVDYYGVTIEDIYSKKLLTLHLSKSLRAIENVLGLNKALKIRADANLSECIFHSDRGSQYISEAHKKMLKEAGFKISMCKIAQENAYVERIQGTLKYEYYFEHNLTETNLQTLSKKIVKWYNNERPHKSLKMMTPNAFEDYIKNCLPTERPPLNIYKWEHTY